jgi:hypothetical protein
VNESGCGDAGRLITSSSSSSTNIFTPIHLYRSAKQLSRFPASSTRWRDCALHATSRVFAPFVPRLSQTSTTVWSVRLVRWCSWCVFGGGRTECTTRAVVVVVVVLVFNSGFDRQSTSRRCCAHLPISSTSPIVLTSISLRSFSYSRTRRCWRRAC